jgi:diguanylate cyclase (GGDEF)-like protein/PAS domain S-box-containing protein
MEIRTRHMIYQAFLHIQACAMLALGVISLSGYVILPVVEADRNVLPPDSSIAAILLGTGLLGCLYRLPRLARSALILLLGLSAYTLIGRLALLQGLALDNILLSDLQRMRAPLALAFCLLAVGLLSYSSAAWSKRLGNVLGVIVIALAGLSLLSTWLPGLGEWRLGYKYALNSTANFFVLSIGLGLICMSRLPALGSQSFDRSSLWTGALGVVLTCGGWYLLHLQNIESSTQQSELLLSKLQGAIASTLDNRSSLLQRTTEHWQEEASLPSEAHLRQEIRGYLRDFPDIDVVALLDDKLRVRTAIGRDASTREHLQNLLKQPEVLGWLQQLPMDGKTHISQAYNAPSPHSLLAIRLLLDGSYWTLIAGLDLDLTLQQSLETGLGGFNVRVYQNQQLLYDTVAPNASPPASKVGEQAIQAGASGWRLVSYRKSSTFSQAGGFLPNLLMLLGLAFSFFLMISQRLAHIAIEHAQHLQRSNQELEQSLRRQADLQELNRRITDYSMDLLCTVDEHGHFTQVSPSSAAILGFTPEEMVGQHYLQFVVPEDRQRTEAIAASIMAGESLHGFRNCYRRKDGTGANLLWYAGWWSPSERTLLAVAHDITRLLQNEAYAEDQRDILNMISTDQALPDILKTICLLGESQAVNTLCAVMLVDKEQQHLLVGAAPNLPQAWQETLQGMEIGPSAGSCATAVHRRQLVITDDIERDPCWQVLRDQAAENQLRACWSIPLISHHGDVLGTFAIYSREPRSPDDDHLQLIGTLGQLAAIAIERQHDRLRLQESEQRFRSLFTFNPDPVFSFDLAGRYTGINQAGCSLSGYSEAEILGRPISLMLVEQDLPRAKERIKAALKGQPQHYELACRARDGRLLELDLTNLPIIVDEKIVGVFGIAKDISERNRMNRAMRETLQRSEHQAQLLRGLSETAVNINSTLDSQTLLEYMAERLRLLIGAHQASMILFQGPDAATSITAFSLSDKYADFQDYQLPHEGSGAYALACEIQQPIMLDQAELEQHPRWSALNRLDQRHPPMQGWLATPLKDFAGNNLGLLQLTEKCTGEFDQNDLMITQQFAQMAVSALENNRLMQAVIAGERRLKSQLDFTSAITDSIAEGLLAVDLRGALSFINPTAADLLGHPPEALLGKTLTDFLALPLTHIENNQHGEINLPLKDKGERYIAYDSAPLLDDSGPLGWVVAFRDITARKEADKQLRVLQRSLEASYNGAIICDALADNLPIIYVNPAFERITGYSAAEALGQNCRFLQGQEHDQVGINEIRQGLAEQRDSHVVLRNFRKDGTPFWNDLYIAPVPNENGKITHFIGVLNDISEQRRYETELAYNASHDVLTGLPNRSLLEDRLKQGCQISQRYSRSLAVMFIDLDGFKPINDSMGHGVGDQILIEVARRMNQQVRPGDTVARLGGDEFVVILPDLAREEDVLLVVDRVIESIARPYKIAKIELRITASIGITLSDGSVEDPMLLIQQADLAMFKAKQQGRNNYQWYTEDLNLKVSERVTLRNALQKAIEAEAFELYYQPQIDGRSGRIIGYEALLRWQHAEHGFISPAQFVPLAEDTGQIIPLSEWVLSTACQTARKLIDQGYRDGVMAVNVSPVQFQRSNFVETVQAALDKAGLPADHLELEITETVLLDNAERAIFTLHALKSLGVRIAIDDFGTGFSSLNYLKRLPVDKVKIDRSFVQEVISDSNDAAITQGIISMAHHLKLKVIAEGVETEPQFAFLKKSHCDEFQGFYFAKPMPLDKLDAFLRQQGERQSKPSPESIDDANKQTLLLLDDEENILRALARVLRRDGYHILTANRAQDAFALLAKNDVQVILSDQRMPEMNGTEFLSRVKDLYPDTIRIVLSGYTDLKSVTDAINQGAIYKFLTKPWNDDQLRATIAQAFQHYNLAKPADDRPQPLDNLKN